MVFPVQKKSPYSVVKHQLVEIPMAINKFDYIHEGLHHMVNASNLDELRQIFERLMQKFGFDQFALQFTPSSFKTMDLKPLAIANYDKTWVRYYFDQAYHLIDPVIIEGGKKKTPFLWSDTWRDKELSKKQKQFFHEAKDHGVGTGIGLPISSPYHRNGMVTLVSSYMDTDEMNKILEDEAVHIYLLSMNFQQMAHYLIVRDKISIHTIPLSDREQECLKWAAVGKSNKEIGMILNISFRTVEHHFQNCYRKLNAVSREQAVAKAIITKSINL